MALYKSKFGRFSDDGSEFIVTRPALPRPWMNVLTNGSWCYVCSHLGGGYSFQDDPSVGRITRWHIDGVPRETVGKFVYVIDRDSGEYWCANGYPPTTKLDSWESRIGLGYNRIDATHKGIASSITYFVPMNGDPLELWLVTLTNTTRKRRRIRTLNYAELALGNWWEDTSWREFYLLFNRQKWVKDALLTRSTQWVKYVGGWQAANSNANNIPFDKAVFMRSSVKPTGYEGDRYRFIGDYRSLAEPQACRDGRIGRNAAIGRDACHALQHDFTLKPGQTAEYVVMLGTIPLEARYPTRLVNRYGTPEKARGTLEKTTTYWRDVLSTPRIQTPDKNLNVCINQWFKYQAGNLAWWNRNTGYCYSGIYNFGVRDACQDAVYRLPSEPEWVRNHIVNKIMIWQFEDGSYAHGGNFISMTGTRTYHSDDPINPLFIVARYILETGDFSVLDEVTPYAHTNGTKKATIYTHLNHGLDFFFSMFSKRGLPLILKADWNDALDQAGNGRKGESFMLAGWAIYCIELFYPALRHKNDSTRLNRYRRRVDALKKTLNKYGWDGTWYRRATHDDGTIIGTASDKEGRIWSNVNSFATISGAAPRKRAITAMESVHRHLDSDLGAKTFGPAYKKPNSRVGIISRFAPGTKENAAVFGHSSMWRIWAECYLGRGNMAYDILNTMMPTTRARKPELYKVEPYVRCQFIYSEESDNPGEGSHSWATGTAAWNLIVVWEWLFGIRPTLDGLIVDPCFPSHWRKARITRRFRGATYDITIRNPHRLEKGRRLAVTLDGTLLRTNVLPVLGDGKTHPVEVVMKK
jgi:cellobiose phosphorylase